MAVASEVPFGHCDQCCLTVGPPPKDGKCKRCGEPLRLGRKAVEDPRAVKPVGNREVKPR